METKAISLTIIFAALTVALNPDISRIALPAPYAPFLIYQIWEIPIVAALLLLNLKSALAIAGLNAVVLFAIFQGASPLGPVYNLTAIFSMIIGIYIAHALFYKRLSMKEISTTWKYNTALATAYTSFGITFRTIVMAFVNYFTLQYPPPVGYALAKPIVIDYYVPVASLFNATLALYTIPLGYFIAVVIKRNLRHANML
jgi:riboflavin transporter FmnP